LATSLGDEETLAESRGVELEVGEPPADLLAFGDKEMLAQVVRNILGNAIRHAAKKVSLQVELVDTPLPGEKQFCLKIQDDGPGVAPEIQEKLFLKYESTAQSSGGTGLGLYISRKLMALHRGSVALEHSEPGQTVFRLILPRVYPVHVLPDLNFGSRVPVTIVSNQSQESAVLEGLLVEGGVPQVQVISSQEAFDHFEGNQSELVVLDATSLEDQLYRLIKLLNRQPALEVIVVGPLAEEEEALLNHHLYKIPQHEASLAFLQAAEKALQTLMQTIGQTQGAQAAQ